MLRDIYPVQWAAQRAVVTLPEHIDVHNAGPIREELLSVINRGAEALIVDMSATISCDHAGADAMVRASQRAAVSGTKLRLVVTARIVSRVLGLSGLDRLVSIYPSLEAAMAASRAPAEVPASADPGTDQRMLSRPAGRRRAEVPAAWRSEENGANMPTATARKLVDALQDGVALADGDGTVALASRRLEEMFGYAHAELPGRLVESLMPPGQQAADPSYWASHLKAPRTRPAGAGRRLAGLRKNGTTFPAEINLSPVTTADARFTMVVIRDITGARRLGDLADQARAAVTAELEHRDREPADTIITGPFHVGLSLQAAMDQPADEARKHIAAAVGYLDETIREVRGTAFTARGRGTAST